MKNKVMIIAAATLVIAGLIAYKFWFDSRNASK